ncbi:MAG: large conductance mechanosensitive channel protein MscL [Prochlorococcaceae cyanobacterium ETNP2_MAG_10]|nr:large conductance mechanosensitive channel protein MscL [Prochlorococcaceae cyanobacterium ETNP2_MAG_10]
MASRRKISKVINDFKAFINRGNVVDLAVAVIIGGAFSKVVNALVKLVTEAVMTPTIDKLQVESLGALPGGALLEAVINFLVVAFVVFVVVEAVERLKRKEEAIALEEPDAQKLLTETLQRLTEALNRRQL